MSTAKILIIEDDATILRVVKDNFAARGFRVQTARKGEVFGKPRIAYSKLSGDKSTQQDFVSAALKAIADCTPLKFSDQLGGAVAGRPFSIRFIGRASEQRT